MKYEGLYLYNTDNTNLLLTKITPDRNKFIKKMKTKI